MQKDQGLTSGRRGISHLNAEQRKERSQKAMEVRLDKTIPYVTHGE